MSTRLAISALVYMMVNAVMFGAGLIAVLLFPPLLPYTLELITAVVIVSLIGAAPVAWYLAPRLRARYWRQQRFNESYRYM